MSSDLLACKLLPGQRVSLGRKANLELTVNRPYLSSLHCQVQVEKMTSDESGGYCKVCDHSHNGTWLLPAGRTDLSQVVRLTKGELKELACGDTLLLVSPQHVHCRELMFTLERGKGEGEYVLRQLSPSHHFSQTQGVKRRHCDEPLVPTPAAVKMAKPNSHVGSSALTDCTVAKTPPTSPAHPDNVTTELENCPHCIQLFSIDDLPTHVDSCPLAHPSIDQCPLCGSVYPLTQLVTHVDTCSGDRKHEEEVPSTRRNYTLEPYSEPASNGIGSADHVIAVDTEVDGANVKAPTESEHCQHCLGLFPLDQLVDHALSCSHRKDLFPETTECEDGCQRDPIERCMHCFRDFPLSDLVNHSNSCRGDMLGPRERFTEFLPSVHDMDPMTLSVLTEAQLAAVQYVTDRSKLESERVYAHLKHRVVSLGYSERDLETTLRWVRRDAPIIVHVNLDRVLPFLVKDTHYRNLFEVGKGGGGNDMISRSGWEDRIFNKHYASSHPVERVKYGVLNIVGDPRSVQSCYHYGDSFLQLKKVRLRTTFASTDTALELVQLSCCEHYGNVLNEYTRRELQAILNVATGKQPFLQSNVISNNNYKEVQIHGPLCLSENVDCIVVNERHIGDRTVADLLDQFVERNKCNLLWMDSVESIGYPPGPPRRRRSRRRRAHHAYDEEY